MLKTFALLLIALSASTMAAHAQQSPATAPDPKMPPMPSMEAPDSNDMTKPSGPAKSAAAPKAERVKRTVPVAKGRQGQASKPLLANKKIQTKTRAIKGNARKSVVRGVAGKAPAAKRRPVPNQAKGGAARRGKARR